MAPGRGSLLLLHVALAASCATARPAPPLLPPPQPGMICDGDRDGDGRVIWWFGKLDYTCTSTNPADTGARIDLYRRGEMEWEHLGGDGRVLRLVRPGEEDLSSTNLSEQSEATFLVVATFLDGAGRVMDVETVLLQPDPHDPYGWLAPQ